MTTDWDESAAAWIASVADGGDFARKRVLDGPMLARVAVGGFRTALDIGCGEGRFCRLLRDHGVAATGIDPTQALIDKASELDAEGHYVRGWAENLSFNDGSFDLVISYLSLIDIEDYRAAIAEMVRVLRPGGSLLIANLASHHTAANRSGMVRQALGKRFGYAITDYTTERASQESWAGIKVRNWHRPLSAYMQACLANGLTLRVFDEPRVPDPQTPREVAFNRLPWLVIMEWQKPQ